MAKKNEDAKDELKAEIEAKFKNLLNEKWTAISEDVVSAKDNRKVTRKELIEAILTSLTESELEEFADMTDAEHKALAEDIYQASSYSY